MKNINWVRKLTSRKLWLSVASFTSLIIVAKGGTENQAAQVASIIMAGATVLGYLLSEGLIDAANAQTQGPEELASPIGFEYTGDEEEEEE